MCRGQVHLLIDSINKAIVDFNKSVSINPNFPVAYAQKLFTDYRKTYSGFSPD
jgi:mitochondrial import receptor subunit TOM70